MNRRLRKSVHMNISKLEAAVADIATRLEALRIEIETAKACRDPFATHIYQSRRRFREEVRTDNKGGKHTERMVLQSYREAQRFGFEGSMDDWYRVLRCHK
jgi:hypothetical protein